MLSRLAKNCSSFILNVSQGSTVTCSSKCKKKPNKKEGAKRACKKRP